MSRITLGRNRVKGQLCIEPAMEPMEERLLLSGTGHVLSFEPAVQYANGGTSAICAVAGDFNNDGKLDLITANPDAGTLSLFPGNGDGTFGTATSIPSGTIPSSVAAADFNGDGKLDLVVTNLSSSQVMVYMGNGDGTFQRAVDYSSGVSEPAAIVTGDFNGDGKADFAVAGLDGIAMFLDNGNGTFTESDSDSTPDMNWSIAAGDLNGDGKIDLVIPNHGANTVTVFWGKGDGTFTQSLDRLRHRNRPLRGDAGGRQQRRQARHRHGQRRVQQRFSAAEQRQQNVPDAPGLRDR